MREDCAGGLSSGWDFRSTPKVGPLSHRAASTTETLVRVRAHARRVPITRVADLTPLDPLRLPVFSATTPLARDLTTHLGKGLNAETARLSAMVEAIERVSAESVPQPVVRCAFAELSRHGLTAIDPHDFDLPDDTAFNDHARISWVQGWDLARETPAWLPVDLVVTPPVEGVLLHADTNGLAAGNTLLEAVVHGLCEVIERDALGQLLFRWVYADPTDAPADPPIVTPESLPGPAQPWVERVAAHGLTLRTELLPQDIGVPVFRSVLIDGAFPGNGENRIRTFVGLGAGPNAAVAAIRSITEAVQSRLAIVQGARDSFNALAPPWRPAAPARDLADVDGRPHIALDDIPTFSSADLLEDYQYLLARLRRAGFDRIIAVDLSRPEFGMAVVRIRVPGLTSFAVNRTRVGWRCLRYLL